MNSLSKSLTCSALLCVVSAGLCLSGCGPQPAAVEEVRPGARWKTVEAGDPDDPAEKFLTADELRKGMGANENAEFEKAGRKFISAFLVNTGVKTLEPLAGQPLRRIDVSRNSITEISPLQGMPLEQASFYETKVSDLSPLSESPLVVLDLTRTQVKDLTPLAASKTLTTLYLEGALVSDLAPLKDVPLEILYLNECPVQDISPLAGKTLQELNLCDTQIASLEGLRGMNLGILWVRNTAISDLTPLQNTGIVSLDIQGSQVADLSPLKGMDTLQRLNLAESKVTDLRPLAGLALQRLIFTPGNITEGIDVIRGMSSLRELDTSFEGDANPLKPEEFWAKYDAGEFEKPVEQKAE